MNEKLTKPYDPKATEDRIYKMWEESGYFNPDNLPGDRSEPYSIILPPPNVTGTLHTGHSMMVAIQDAIIRYQRMRGKKALWLPGTDHAAIATESKVAGIIAKKEKKSKHDLGREEFVRRVEEFAQDSHDTIVGQVRRLGASLDWSREVYSLDEKRSLAVRTAFKRMYDAGLIYRGKRIVNWDPKGQTTISDDEVVYKEQNDPFYYFKYGPFTIGTVRPETKFGDKYVVMHPDDDRYSEYQHGQKIGLEWINGPITATVIKDEAANPEVGSGVMTITPAHSAIDFEIAERHDLDIEPVINERGILMDAAGEFAGEHIKKARVKIIEKMESKGLIEKVDEDYVHNVATAERTGEMIEPQIKEQWWINVNKSIPERDNKTLKELMQETIRGGATEILPERFEKVYFNWIDNLRDWNISRQLWFGHRIPVWYDKDGGAHLPREQKVMFARHGESEFNKEERYAGQIDTDLTETGQEQAKELAARLTNLGITKIVASPLTRARKTAEAVASELGLELEIWDELMEMDAGDMQGKPRITGKTLMTAAIEAGSGEGLDSILDRAKKVIDKLKTIETDGPVLVVGHGSMNKVIQAVIDGIPEEKIVSHCNFWPSNVSVSEKALLADPQDPDLTQDPDTLDTWFSAGLMTFADLGWPEETEDLKTYHPTNLLETGYDIIFFWVARMILMSQFFFGETPFKTVYLHGLVRDEQGRKMSKSLGNIMDPVEFIDEFGADALRMALLVGVGPGNDSAVGRDKVKAYKHFANKLWNISRYILDCQDENNPPSREATARQGGELKQDLVDEFNAVAKEVTEEIEKYNLYLATEKLYAYAWHRLADEIIEESKSDKEAYSATLHYILTNLLKLLHPFMPFVTEEIWGIIHGNDQLLMIEPWPHRSNQ